MLLYAVARRLVRRWRRATRRRVPNELRALLAPLSPIWGLERGTPIEIYYIERFMARHRDDIRGRVLEVGDARYSSRFASGAEHVDVLNLTPGNPNATLVGDLQTGAGIQTDSFDCLVIVNTFLQVYDITGAIRTCYRALRPGGVLLANFTGIARRAYNDTSWGPPGWHGEGDYWRFTSAGVRRLCADAFGAQHVEVETFGNVRTGAASLYGLAVEDLPPASVDHHDPNFEVVICACARKPG